MNHRIRSALHLTIAGVLAVCAFWTAGCRQSEAPTTDEGTEAAPDTEQVAAAADVLYAWLQYSETGLEARAIVDAGSVCPAMTASGTETAMSVRADAGIDFAVVSCAANVPASATAISIGAKALPTPTDTPTRILVLGDTGCRIKGNWQENCNGKGSGTPWSFPEAARVAAAEQPDLIVHVGDYVYREAACDATQQPGCAGSPWGDKWDTWETDFFVPSGPLLDAAPWIVTRGNHEDCGRNHLGWLRFLDGRPLGPSDLSANGCPQFSSPYKVAFSAVDFLVLNTTTDPTTPDLDPSAQARYAEEFTKAAAMVTAGRPAWTVTHRPFWALSPDWKNPDALEAVDSTLQEAIAAMPGGGWPAEVDLSLAGHVHLLETLTFTDGRPHQVVSGDAGTAQDSPITAEAIAKNPQVFTELGMKAADFNSFHDFGYVLLEPSASGWTVTVKDLAGEVLEQFHLQS